MPKRDWRKQLRGGQTTVPFGWFPPETANSKASRALMLIRKFQKEEERKIDYSNTETMQIPAGGNWIVEGFGPYMAQGSTNQTRIGNKITVKSLAMRFVIRLSVLEALGTSVRVCLVMDRKPEGADATSTMVFATDNQLNSGYTISDTYKGRFQIFYDKTFSFDSVEAHKADKIFLKRNIKILYNGNAGTVADIQKNNFLFMTMAEANAAAINVDYGFIFRWTDA